MSGDLGRRLMTVSEERQHKERVDAASAESTELLQTNELSELLASLHQEITEVPKHS